jgi:LEA14-like dessication related protein
MKKIIFFLLVVVSFTSCSSYEKPVLKEISSTKINIKNKFTKVNGTLVFTNPNAESIGLNEMYFDVFFNGNDVGSFTKKTDAIIAGQGQISLPFYIEVNNDEYDSKVEEIELELKGYVNGKIKNETISLSFDERKMINPNSKIDTNDSEKSKEEIKQEKKEQKKLEKENKKLEETKRKALKEINA